MPENNCSILRLRWALLQVSGLVSSVPGTHNREIDCRNLWPRLIYYFMLMDSSSCEHWFFFFFLLMPEWKGAKRKMCLKNCVNYDLTEPFIYPKEWSENNEGCAECGKLHVTFINVTQKPSHLGSYAGRVLYWSSSV